MVPLAIFLTTGKAIDGDEYQFKELVLNSVCFELTEINLTIAKKLTPNGKQCISRSFLRNTENHTFYPKNNQKN